MDLNDITTILGINIVNSAKDSDVLWYSYVIGLFNLQNDSSIGAPMGLFWDPNYRIPVIKLNFPMIEKLKWTKQEIFGVLLHEVNHFLQLCLARRGFRDADELNIAADAVINTTLMDDKKKNNILLYDLPKNGIFFEDKDRPSSNDLYTEWVYDNMPEKMKQACKKGTMVLVDDHSGLDSFDGLDDEELKLQVLETINAVSKSMGHTPGSVKSILDKILKPKINWRNQLRNFFGNNLKIGTHQTWKRPNRRFGQRQPGRQVERSGTLAFIVDTSGSVPEDDLSQAYGEIAKIAETFKVTVIQCDAAVRSVKPFTKKKDIQLTGRGGTDMNPGLKQALELKADFIVCFTDGFIPAPIDMKKPVLWVITSNGSTAAVKDLRHVQIIN